ncbi:MAG TPA: hypothetical protein VNM40_01985 [Candidatus Paceibacterota bacterium]|nr:hypothetical protein [Candidatus Paceibacterota bacterium]
MSFIERHPVRYLVRSLSVVIGIVLIWRGIWYTLDWFDMTFLNGSHVITALGGIALGLLILYLPDRDLKELGRL